MSYSSTQLADSPFARWRFEETSGTAHDDDIGGADGSNSGSVTTGVAWGGTESGPGRGVDLTGGYVRVTGGSGRTSGWPMPNTIEVVTVLDAIDSSSSAPPAFFTQTYTQGPDVLVPLQLGFNLDLAHSAKLGVGYFYLGPTTRIAIHMTDALSTGTLYHFVGVFDPAAGPSLSLYVNGTLNVTGVVANRPAKTIQLNAGAYIGRWESSSPTIDGRIFDVALYSTALSAERVTAHYNALIAPPMTPVAAAVDLQWDVAALTSSAVDLRWNVHRRPPNRFWFTGHPSDYL